jgi:SWIM zinc finger
MTLEAAQLLASDDSTLRRAEALANPRKWIIVERNERALWGECSGSGSDPYRAIVDLNGPAYKCSCPVKRFPCKHTLALLLMFADNTTQNFANNIPPQYVTDWIDTRDRRSVVKNIPKTEEQIAKSEVTKQKKWEERLGSMTEGIADVQSRLLDILREGIANLENTPSSFFTDFAARLVDAKLGGLSKRVKAWVHYKEKYPESWYEKLLSEIGTLYLFTKAFQNFDRIPEALQDDLFIQSGVTIKKEELLSQKGIEDDWFVLGQVETQEEDNLTSRRVWLIGKETGKMVLVLDFAFGNMGFQTAWLTGYAYKAEVVYYPAAYPLRVVVKALENAQIFSQIIGFQDFTQFLNTYSKAVGQNPWLVDFPVLVAQVVPLFSQNTFMLLDKNEYQLPLAVDYDMGWKLIALSGGNPLAVFGEWHNGEMYPLSIFAEGRFINLV